MIPSTLSLPLTYECNFRCKYCSVPKYNQVMSKDTMLSAIQQFSELKLHIRPGAVVFTGDEVTLYKGLLLEGIKAAHERNLITRVVTNSWWA
ncbi:MAG: radical SAM protein [Sulfolobus sp.]|nr:radical SAM protein [Sulfolobus sp.]